MEVIAYGWAGKVTIGLMAMHHRLVVYPFVGSEAYERVMSTLK